MSFPLSFWDVGLLLAIMAIVLIITSEMLSSHYGKISIHIDRKKLRKAAFVVSILFLATVAITLIRIISTK